MIGSRSTNNPAAAGSVSSTMQPCALGQPSHELGTVATQHGPCQLGLERRRDRDGQQSVRQHEPCEGVDVRGQDARTFVLGEVADHDHRDLVGGDEPERPSGQHQQLANRRVLPLEGRPVAETGGEHRRQRDQRHRRDADRCAETERPTQTLVAEHILQAPVRGAGTGQRQQRDDDDRRWAGSGSTRRRRTGACSGGRHCRGRSVRRRGSARGRPGSASCPRSGRDRGRRRSTPRCCRGGRSAARRRPRAWSRRSSACRRGEDDVGGACALGRLPPSPCRWQERREQRHQRRREHTAEQQVVDDVRGLVAELVGVAERRLPDHVGEDEHAQQPADPRERGPGGDDQIGAQQ